MSELSEEARAQAGPRRRSPGRPRDPEAVRRIFDAAIEEYLERGSAGFTMDGVARRAGVGKSTVYLRWADRDTLLVESVLARSRSIEEVDTGTLHEDLVQLTVNLLRYLLDPIGWATFRLAVDAVANPAYGHVAQVLATRHRDAILRIFERAHARGEPFDPETVNSVVESVYGAVVLKVLTRGLEDAVSDGELVASCRVTVDLLFPGGRRP
jgi:AcrR family transcriptional regulator